jgi:hypothetical protein
MDLCAATKPGSTSCPSDQPESLNMNVKYRYDIPSIETVEDAPHSSDAAVAGGRARQEARALPSQGLAWTAFARASTISDARMEV